MKLSRLILCFLCLGLGNVSDAFAAANRSDRFTMVNVSQEDITRALSTNKIDVMLSSAPFSAEREITYKSMPVDILYYDQQMFLARKIEGATSMEAYKGAKVCVVSDTDDYHNLVNYSRAYKLDLVPLPFKLQQRATEAFLLNRCPFKICLATIRIYGTNSDLIPIGCEKQLKIWATTAKFMNAISVKTLR